MFRTTDLYVCAFMITQGVNLFALESLENTRCVFIMDCKPERGLELQKRYEGNEKIGILTLKYALKQSKDLLFNFIREHGTD